MNADPRVLLVWGQYPRWIPPVTFSSRQVTLAARLKTINGFRDQSDHDFCYFEDFAPNGWLPNGSFDLMDYCARNGLPVTYDFVILFLDQDMGIFPANIAGFGCPSVLLVGDSHHFMRPISTLISYVWREEIDAVVTQFTGHHTHWFRDAGISESGFIPGLETREMAVDLKQPRIDRVTFVGHHWPYHFYRWNLHELMRQHGIPLNVKIGTREEAAEAYGSSLVSFNCSLNGDVNIRNFEVLASGGFLLTDALPEATGFSVLFRPGGACDTYRDGDELVDKLAFYRRNPEAATRLAFAGHAHFCAALRPQRALARFADAIFAGRGLADCLPPDPRCRHPAAANLEARLAAYEDIQELHRQQRTVRVLVEASADWFRREDYADLPRVSLFFAGEGIASGSPWDFVVR